MKLHPTFIPLIVFVGTLPFVFCHPTHPASTALSARIDEHIELTSIVARPTGYKSIALKITDLCRRNKDHLGPNKAHPLIHFNTRAAK